MFPVANDRGDQRRAGGRASLERRTWARSVATDRLRASASRTSAGRQGLRAAESALVSDVADLELVAERARLYRAGAPDEADAPAVAPSNVCPYKGLAAFEASDSAHYFGRERLVAELVARLVGSSFLGVVGASGSGKSSAVRAGLLPALAGGVLPGSDQWQQVVIRPGDRPMAELNRALRRFQPGHDPVSEFPKLLEQMLDGLPVDARVVLVVDQFEETFNAARDDAERLAFIDLLTAEHRGLKVVVVLRSDHYGHCAEYPALATLIGTNQVLVGPLIPAELEAVIELPARQVGLTVEPALTKALLADLGDEPGALPLLSTALLELWQARDGSRLTLAAYHASTGVRGAVARLAENTFARLGPQEQNVGRAMFLRLAGTGDGEGVVRRRVTLAELDAERDPVVAHVLTVLTDARLLTSGDGYTEVAHEALLREWPRLQGWLAEDAVGRELRLHLIDAAREWQTDGRDPGDLYRGARLAAALEWAEGHAVERTR